MKKNNIFTIVFFLCLTNFLLPSCKGEDSPIDSLQQDKAKNIAPLQADKYVLMTYEKITIPSGPMAGMQVKYSYISHFGEMPSGNNVSNQVNNNTLQGRIGKNGGGLIQTGNRLYRRSNSANFNDIPDRGTNTPTMLRIPYEGHIRETVFQHLSMMGISQDLKNFAIDNNTGFLCLPPMHDESLIVYMFDPISMSILSPRILINKSTDLAAIQEKLTQVSPELEGITFTHILLGMNLCVRHNDLLITDIAFISTEYPNVAQHAYLVSMEAKHNGAIKNFSVIKNTGQIGNDAETEQHCHDEKGDLYILARGKDPAGFYRNSVISRIRNNCDSVDTDWELRIADVVKTGPARFNGIFVAQNKIITLVNSQSLVSTTKDMNLENVWDYYVIDIETKEAKKIEGIKPSSAFLAGANLVSHIDGKYYLRYVRTGNHEPYNGYCLYDFNTNRATPAFNVSEGGYVIDLKKITISGN